MLLNTVSTGALNNSMTFFNVLFHHGLHLSASFKPFVQTSDSWSVYSLSWPRHRFHDQKKGLRMHPSNHAFSIPMRKWCYQHTAAEGHELFPGSRHTLRRGVMILACAHISSVILHPFVQKEQFSYPFRQPQ